MMGAGVLPHDVHMRDALAGQDHLYSLTLLKHPDGTRERRVVDAIFIDYRYGPDDPQGLIDLLAKIDGVVSLTITEAGTTSTR